MKHNRIYVRIAEDDDFGTASIEQRPFTEAYIRKDALLEWAKERQAFYRKRGDDIEDDSNSEMAYFYGKEYAFRELIDKIESL